MQKRYNILCSYVNGEILSSTKPVPFLSTYTPGMHAFKSLHEKSNVMHNYVLLLT